MKTHINIILITAAVLAGTILLIVDYHRATEDVVIQRFRAHQTMVVRQLTQEIEQYLRARSQGAQVLSTFASLQHRDMKKMAAEVQAYFEYVKKDYVKAISVYDENGTIIYSTTGEAIGRNYADCDFSQWAAKKESKSKLFISSLIRAAENQNDRRPFFRFLIAVPVYQEARDSRYPKPTHKFAGVLTVTIDLEEVIAAFLPPFSNNTSIQHVWIVDTSGIVLFQSEHPEMVLNSNRRRDETCVRCHVSFDYVKKILAEKQGAIEYSPREQARKVATFAPLTFENVTWIIAVNVPFDEVTGFVNRQLTRTFLLISLIVAALIGASALIYRSNRSKIRAQEEAKQWRERRGLEEKVRESEERYRQLVEVSPDAIVIHCEGKIVFVNSAGVQTLRARTTDELIGKPALEIVHPDDREMVKRRIEAVLAEGKPAPLVEERFLRLDGSVIDVEVAAVATRFQDKPAVQVVVRDITERKRAEEALRESEGRNRDLVEHSSDLICTHDLEGKLLSANPAATKLTGFTKQEFVGRNLREFIAPESRRLLSSYLTRIQATGSASGLLPVVTKSGERRIWEYFNTLRTVGVSVPIVRSLARDITDRRRMEQALRNSERQYRLLFENMLNGFANCEILYDEQGRPADLIFVAANSAFEQMTGLKDVVGKRLNQVVPDYEELSPALVGVYERIVTSGVPEAFEMEVKPLGKVFAISAYSTHKGYFAVVVDDITERKMGEAELLKSKEHLELLTSHLRNAREEERARISREIHDELGQSLTALNIDLNWMQEQTRVTSESRKKLTSMLRIVTATIGNVQRIASDLRPAVLDDLGLTAAVEWYCEDFEERSGIRCRAALEDVEPVEPTNKLDMFRLLQESLTNVARHAHAAEVTIHLSRVKNDITLEIIDDGIGIDQDSLSASASLGIIGMRERVTQCRGEITISRNKTRGTRVVFTLPAGV